MHFKIQQEPPEKCSFSASRMAEDSIESNTEGNLSSKKATMRIKLEKSVRFGLLKAAKPFSPYPSMARVKYSFTRRSLVYTNKLNSCIRRTFRAYSSHCSFLWVVDIVMFTTIQLVSELSIFYSTRLLSTMSALRSVVEIVRLIH